MHALPGTPPAGPGASLHPGSSLPGAGDSRDGQGGRGSGRRWAVLDLFSGAGGMSFGFCAHPAFAIAGAVDAQLGKPSAKRGGLGCNDSYQVNVGIRPVEADLGTADPAAICRSIGLDEITVLTACPPCTGFSRTTPANHLTDDARNSLVGVVGSYAELLRPQIVLVENARELVMGRFSGHLRRLLARLSGLGYRTRASTHVLSDFGLPQRRERALVVAVREPLPLLGLAELWSGLRVSPKATHVRRAIWDLPPAAAGQAHPADPLHVSPALTVVNQRRLAAIPGDGGSWTDLAAVPGLAHLLTPAMRRRAAAGQFGSHPDIYGRLRWDRPAVTVKRECGHLGNGRYAHPEQDRLCTVREMSLLQGFPRGYAFTGSLSNMYRHVGDAVPPLISYQLAVLAEWILTGSRPPAGRLLLGGCHLTGDDLEPAGPR